MKRDLQKIFISNIDELLMIAKELTEHETLFETGQFTDELRASYKDSYALYEKVNQEVDEEMIPLFAIKGDSCSLIDEIESIIMNSVNPSGYVRGIVQKLADVIDATKIMRNKYSGGVAFDSLQYYVNRFLGYLDCLCRNYDINLRAILETETYLYVNKEVQDEMQGESNSPDHDKFMTYFVAKKEWWNKLITDISANLISGRGDYTIVAMAKVLYDSGKIHESMKPEKFASWLRAFCDAWAIDHIPTCKAGHNGVKKEIKRMKRVFYYFDDMIPK